MKCALFAIALLLQSGIAIAQNAIIPPSATAASQPADIRYVAGSTRKVCQLTGQTDKEYDQPTVNLTEKRFGLAGTDRGYSFEHNGKLFFLFGDTPPTATFDGKPNKQTDPPRTTEDNDAIAFSTDPAAAPCVNLYFTLNAIGAFKNPVVLNAKGEPAITLRTNETPIAGISDGGRMYVIFGTDNFLSNPTGGTSSPSGGATRSVMAASDDDANTFQYLYNFSKGPGAKFIMNAIARAPDGYLYFWGTQGDTLFRKSPPFLARKPAGAMNDSTAIEYLHALNADGTPVFMPQESAAAPLFHDSLPDVQGRMQAADCMGEVGVEWNPFVRRWVMLYNSSNNTAANPRGIWMRTSAHPWGPWSAPQTIFNAIRDSGLCRFMHRAVNAQNPLCDSLSGSDRLGESGGDYAPYFISRFTTGDSTRAVSTFYYAMSTWNPYEVVIMQSTIQGSSPAGVPPSAPIAPAGAELEQNYPNPFSAGGSAAGGSPSTTFSYSIPTGGPVRLAVYDMLGRLVVTLVRKEMSPGRYTAGWSGEDAGGGTVPGGVYLLRLETASSSAVRKMILMR